MNEQSFIFKAARSVAERKSLLCCGLDPDPARLPQKLKTRFSLDEGVAHFLTAVVDATHPFVCAYKIQKAYFDLLDRPHRVLTEVVEHIRRQCSVPIILDAKIGDIGNTMKAYLRYATETVGVDAIMTNPYMGDDVFDCFRKSPPCGSVMLCRTSGNGSGLIQDMELKNGEVLWEAVLQLTCDEYLAGSDIAPVLASTDMRNGRPRIPRIPVGIPIFVAGYGAQGGSADFIRGLRDQGHKSLLVNSSRDIIFAFEKFAGQNWCDVVGAAAERVRDVLWTESSSRSAQ